MFVKVLFSRNFAYAKFRENKPSRNGDITLSFTDICKSCPCHKILTWQICLLTLFAKINILRKFPNLQFKSCLSDWSVLQVSVINQLSTCPQIILTRFAKNQSPLVLHLPGLSSPQVKISCSATGLHNHHQPYLFYTCQNESSSKSEACLNCLYRRCPPLKAVSRQGFFWQFWEGT